MWPDPYKIKTARVCSGQRDKFMICLIFRCLEKLLKPVSLLIVFLLDLGTLKGKIVISKKQPENPNRFVSVSLNHKRGRFLSGGKAKERDCIYID